MLNTPKLHIDTRFVSNLLWDNKTFIVRDWNWGKALGVAQGQNVSEITEEVKKIMFPQKKALLETLYKKAA